MKRVRVCAVVAALVLVSSTFAPGFLASMAWGADKNVVVEGFDGPDSDKLRGIVKKAIEELSGFSLVSDRKLASTEADLGLMQASDAYEAVARELGAVAFVKGVVVGGKAKKPTVTVTIEVRDSSGKKIGQEIFRGANSKAVLAAAEKGASAALAKLLEKVGPPPQTAKPAVAPVAEKAPAPPKEASAAKAAKETTKRGKASAKVDEADEEDSADTGSDADVSAVASDAPHRDAYGPSWSGLDVTAGMLMYNRTFDFNDKRSGPLQGYKLPLAPAATIAVDYFFSRFLGLTASFEYTLPVVTSENKATGDTFATTSMGWNVGIKGKFALLDSLELNGSAGLGGFNFFVWNNGNTTSNVSPVDYFQVRAVGGLRFDLGAVALTAGGGYLHPLSLGGIANDFPGAAARGAEANLGVAIPIHFMDLELRASFVARQYGHFFAPVEGDVNFAYGAYDRYLGLNLGIGCRRYVTPVF